MTDGTHLNLNACWETALSSYCILRRPVKPNLYLFKSKKT